MSGRQRLGRNLPTQPQVGIRWAKNHGVGPGHVPGRALIRKYPLLLIRSGVEVADSDGGRFPDGTLLW